MACTINKSSTGLNPFASMRDVMLLALTVGAFALVTLLPREWNTMGGVRLMLFGFVGWMVSSMIENLPVRGSVAQSGEQAFMGRLAQFDYVQVAQDSHGRVYKSRSRLQLWDTDRIIVGPASNGVIPVTVPLRFYRLLKRMQK